VIGLVLSTSALRTSPTSPVVAAAIGSAATGRRYVCVPSTALAEASTDRYDIGLHFLRLAAEIADQRLFIAPLHANAPAVGQAINASGEPMGIADGHTYYEAHSLSWPVLCAKNETGRFNELDTITFD
jgi:hypothetical protein